MNVYRVKPYGKPPGTRFNEYAHLMCKDRDDGFLRTEHFAGRPFPKPWRRIKLYFEKPLLPRADFYSFGISNFVCTERARTLAGPIMEKVGEFLPVAIEGEAETHYLYHATRCGIFMDRRKSIMKRFEFCAEDPWILVEPAFIPIAIRGEALFKIPEESTVTYCVEHPGDRKRLSFKALVEKNNLTGLRFDFAWSEKRGPVSDHSPDDDWYWGDGRKYRGK